MPLAHHDYAIDIIYDEPYYSIAYLFLKRKI
jgi:hypothetical protein